jgi:hypothetical protein
MTPEEIITEVQAGGATLKLLYDRLAIVNRAALPPHLLELIQTHSAELRQFLRGQEVSRKARRILA